MKLLNEQQGRQDSTTTVLYLVQGILQLISQAPAQ